MKWNIFNEVLWFRTFQTDLLGLEIYTIQLNKYINYFIKWILSLYLKYKSNHKLKTEEGKA
jgi:hypothetical protein